MSTDYMTMKDKFTTGNFLTTKKGICCVKTLPANRHTAGKIFKISVIIDFLWHKATIITAAIELLLLTRIRDPTNSITVNNQMIGIDKDK